MSNDSENYALPGSGFCEHKRVRKHERQRRAAKSLAEKGLHGDGAKSSNAYSMERAIVSIFRSLFKLMLLAFAASMVLALLLVGLSAALLTLLWSLLTGRKPAAFATFTRFRDASRQFRGKAWQGGASSARGQSEDIVDVQAHEVRGVLEDKR